MTEAEWRTALSAEPMLVAPSVELTPRHLRLFAVGCALQLLEEHPSPSVAWKVLEYAEQVTADPDSPREMRDRIREYESKTRVMAAGGPSATIAIVNQVLAPAALTAALSTCRTLVLARGGQFRPRRVIDRQHRQLGSLIPGEELPRILGDVGAVCAALLRDIVGNPFRPVTFDPAWRTDTAVAIAQGMYESRDFSAMPILADALQDAGCESENILTHCRDAKQTHVRGCWVVDLVLNKQ